MTAVKVVKRRRSTTSRITFTILCTFAVVLGGGWAAASTTRTASVDERPTDLQAALSESEAQRAAGELPVVDHRGVVRGMASGEEMAALNPIVLPAGRGTVPAYEVRDETGVLTGYLVSTLGFVELGVARSSDRLGALLAEHEAEHGEAIRREIDRVSRHLEAADP